MFALDFDKAAGRIILLAVERPGNGVPEEDRVVLNPDLGYVLGKDDSLIVVAPRTPVLT